MDLVAELAEQNRELSRHGADLEKRGRHVLGVEEGQHVQVVADVLLEIAGPPASKSFWHEADVSGQRLENAVYGLGVVHHRIRAESSIMRSISRSRLRDRLPFKLG